MPSTKKLLVSLGGHEAKEPNTGDFLIPTVYDGTCVFIGVKSGTRCRFGMMVYIGVPITEHDLFAKLVDSGAEIESVDETLACLRHYIDTLQSLRIGNIVRLQSVGRGFVVELAANTPSGFRR